jgi:hypothetical protein
MEYDVHTAHGARERLRIQNVTLPKLYAQGFEECRIAPLPDECPHPMPLRYQ